MKLIFCYVFLFFSHAFALNPAAPAVEKIWESVALISAEGPDDSGDMVKGYCNATVIDKRTLITAAHCFVQSSALNGAAIGIEIGRYKFIEKDGQQINLGYRTTQKFSVPGKINFLPGVNPKQKNVRPELDIVTVKLNSDLDLPADFIFAKVWTKSMPNLVAGSLTVVSVNPIETITHMNTKLFADLNSFRQNGFQIESRSTSRVAPGDSGAGVFAAIAGETYLIGVVKGYASTAFSNWDVIVTHEGRLAP
jgi:hypothetical protein